MVDKLRLTFRPQPHSPAVNRLGLSLVHAPPEPLTDLIFVHGLGGTSHGTWSWERNPDCFWPEWLAQDDELSRSRIFTFGYNADFKQDTSSAILEFSKDLLLRMKAYSGQGTGGKDDIGKNPIVFVMHSMGGLVVKKAYIIGKSDPQYQDMVSRTRAMLFLGTPHRGSAFAELLNNILRTTPAFSGKLYVSELSKAAPSLQDINEQFRTVCQGLLLASLYETQKTRLGLVKKMVVEKDSAVLGYPSEISSPLNADHHGVSKFNSVEDPNYEQVRNILREFVKNLGSLGTAIPSSSRTKLQKLFRIHNDPKFELEVLQSRIMDDSCRWVLDRPTFLKWREGLHDGCALLWLKGLPGVGKSVLSSFVLRSLQTDFPGVACCYHFFNSQDQTKRSVKYMLTNTAFQLALQSRSFCERLIDLHDTGSLPIEQLQAINIWESVFQKLLLRRDAAEPMFWVIDGLDEADHPELLVRLLSKLEPNHCLRILIVSRPIREAAALGSLRINSTSDEITVEDTHGDIQAYAYHEVGTIISDGGIRDGICSKILEKAQGSFLWVTLAIKQLRDDCHTLESIEQVLDDLPKDMEAFYSRMIGIIDSQPARPRALASRILTWAMCSFRPLELAELQTALSLEFGAFLNFEKTVTQICANFVMIKASQAALIHDTARSFLLHRGGDGPLSIDSRLGHQYIAETCLKFLMDEEKDWRRVLSQSHQTTKSLLGDGPQAGTSSVFDKHPFLLYAVTWWAYHVSLAPPSPRLTELVQAFLNKFALIWIHAVALIGDMRIFTRTAEYLMIFLAGRCDGSSRRNEPSNGPWEPVDEVCSWSRDLRRIAGRFGSILVRDPLSIYMQTVPFCPSGSMMRRQFTAASSISVVGISEEFWDDCVARIPVAANAPATHVFCIGPWFVLVVTRPGFLVVHYAESCEEARRIDHGEKISVISCSEASTFAAVAGAKTIRVWDLATGEQLYCLSTLPHRKVLALFFDSNEGRLVIGYDDLFIHCVRLETSEEEWNHQLPELGEFWDKRVMSISSDGRRVAAGRVVGPVYAWDLDSLNSEPHVCLRPNVNYDKVAKEGTKRIPYIKQISWSAGTAYALIRYDDHLVFEWRVEENILRQVPEVRATEMALGGRHLVTCDRFTGAVNIRAFPGYEHIFQIHVDYIHTVAFSPKDKRLYMLSGGFCNVWDPHAVSEPSLNATVEEQLPSTGERPYPITSKPRRVVRSLTADVDGRFYCWEGTDNRVVMHDIGNGQELQQLSTPYCPPQIRDLRIRVKAWSKSRRYFVHRDGPMVAIMEITQPDADGAKRETRVVLEFCVPVRSAQFVFSPSEEYVFVSPGGIGEPSKTNINTVRRLKDGRVVCTSDWDEVWEGAWLQHPADDSLLVLLSPAGARAFEWKTLAEVDLTPQNPGASASEQLVGVADLTPEELDSIVRVVRAVAVNNRLVVFQDRYPTAKILVVGVGGSTTPPQLIEGLSEPGNRLIGTCQGHVVFLDHEYCFCTWDLAVGPPSLKRHLHLPKDWLDLPMLSLCVVTEQGTVLCPRNGEVGVIHGAIKL